MVDRIVDDAANALELLRKVPAWILFLAVTGLTGGSGIVAGNVTGGQATEAVAKMQVQIGHLESTVATLAEALKDETGARMAFEEKCRVERGAFEKQVTDFKIEQQRLQLMLGQNSSALHELIEKVAGYQSAMASYQTSMTGLVRDIYGQVRGWRGADPSTLAPLQGDSH